MPIRSLTCLLAAGLLLAAGAAEAASSFDITCPHPRYASVPQGQFTVFPAPIQATSPQGTDVEVIFQPHVPAGWVAQWCHASTGMCYFDDEVITIPGGVQDAIELEFIPDWAEPGVGYITVIVRSVDDQFEFSRCTVTCFSGVPVTPTPQFSYDCSENTLFLDEPEFFLEFPTIVTNSSDQPELLIVHIESEVPAGWFVQFCQVSTGVCYPEDTVIEIAANSSDIIQVEFLNLDDSYGYGYADFTYLAWSNPSYGRTCRYQVFVGDYSADAPEPAPLRLAARAEPNPFHDSAVLRLAAGGATPTRLEIFGADGRLVRTFGELKTVDGGITWDGRGDNGQAVPSGVYFYRFHGTGAEAGGMIVRSR